MLEGPFDARKVTLAVSRERENSQLNLNSNLKF